MLILNRKLKIDVVFRGNGETQMTKGVPMEFLDLVRSKNDLVDVASKYLTLTHRGGNYWACCPFHNEKTASFSIKPDGQFYKCFGCGEAGNVINFVAKMENIDFMSAVEMLAKNAGLEMPSNEQNEEMRQRKQQRDRLFQILKSTAEFYANNLTNNPNSPQAGYVKSRKLTEETIKKFQIGISLNYDDLPRYLLKQNFKEEDLLAAGVVGKNEHGLYDFYAKRVIFPLCNGFGDVIGFSARTIEQAPEHTKYKNTPQTPIFNKSEILFAYNFARELKKQHLLDSLVIVEGHIDVIMCHQAGITNTIGCMGTALTPQHARKIKQLVDNVIICLDGDSAGSNATYKAIDVLKNEGLRVRVVRLAGAKDPDEYIKKFGKDKFLEFLENSIDCVDFVLQDSAKKYDLNNNADKSKYVAEALNYISKFSTVAEQEIYLSELQQLVKIPLDALRKTLNTQANKVAAAKQPEVEQSTENVKNKYILDSKIMFLAAILHKKVKNIEQIVGFFEGDDELSELYRFLMEKIGNNKDFNISTLFDNFNITPNSLIDKVINYNFPPEDVFETMMKDTIKRVKIYELQQQKEDVINQMNNSTSMEERYNCLNKIKELDDKINKEKM